MKQLAFFLGIAGITYGVMAMLITAPWLWGSASTNGWLGKRFAGLFANEGDWKRLGRYVAIQVWLWATPVLVAGIGILTFPKAKHTWSLALIAIGPLFLLFAAFLSYRRARGLLAQARTEDG